MTDQANTGNKKAPVAYSINRDEEPGDQLETGGPEAREGSEVDAGQLNNSQQDGGKGRGSSHNIIDMTGGEIAPGEGAGGRSLLNVTADADNQNKSLTDQPRRQSAKRLNTAQNSAVNASCASGTSNQARQPTREEKLIYNYIQRMDYRQLKKHLTELASNQSQGGGGQAAGTGAFVDITTIFDRKGFTPLHFAAFQNSMKSAQILVDHVAKYGNGQFEENAPQNREYLRKWINTQSKCDDSFTAMHFASFFGNRGLVQYLIAEGGDAFATNAQDINMLHVGAQGDQPISIALFLSLGLDINSRDKRLSTPLHWAAFAGADLALQYIVAQGAEINAQDIKGLTALHLAVKTAADVMTTRSIRTLLMKGADPLMLDQNDQRPAALLETFDQGQPLMPEYTKEIAELLFVEKETCLGRVNPLKDCECFALKPKVRRRGKASKTLCCYFFLMISSFVLLNVGIYPRIFGETEHTLKTPAAASATPAVVAASGAKAPAKSTTVKSPAKPETAKAKLADAEAGSAMAKALSLWGTLGDDALLYVQAAFFFLSLTLNAILSQKDPGHLQKDKQWYDGHSDKIKDVMNLSPEERKRHNQGLLALMSKYDAAALCFECGVLRTPRSRHCHQCKRCIDVFDHHCPWINNCVGRGNREIFYTYVCVQSTYLALTVAILAGYLMGKAHAAQQRYLKYCAAEGAGTAACHKLLVNSVSYKPTTGALVSSVAMLAVSAFFFLSLMVLCYVQTRNLISGRTTAERYGQPRVVRVQETDDTHSSHRMRS